MKILYDLRKKWAAVYRDSFIADMNSTQRSEGMNNVFKKRFHRRLGLSELLTECDKVSDITNSMPEQSSAISAPYIQGGFTDLLHGVQQDAAMSSSARKLHFDENM